MEKSRSYFETNILISIVLLVGIAILSNVLVRNHAFARADLTEDQENTISDATRNLLGNLPGRIQIKAYITQDVPAQVIALKDKLEDTLNEYRIYSKGKISIDWFDPSVGTVKKEAEDSGIRFLNLQAIERDKRVAKQVAFGLILRYKDKEKLIPVVWIGDLPNLEYQLTTSIKSLVDPKKKTVGFLTREEPETPQFPGMMDRGNKGRIFNVARQSLGEHYTLSEVDVKEGKPIAEDIDILVVAKPKDMGEREKFEIDQFVMRGGRALFLIDQNEYNFEMGFMGTPIKTGLDDLFEQYGFRVERELIFDASCLPVNVPDTVEISGRRIRLEKQTPYPFWVRALPEGFSKENPITSRADSAAFLWASPVSVLGEKVGGLKTEEIVRSSGTSYRTDQVDKTFPDEKNLKMVKSSLRDQKPAPSAIAVALSGKFASLFTGKEVPKLEKPPVPPAEDGNPVEEKKEEEAPRSIISESPDTRILVFGDSDFISDHAASFQPNMVLFLNAIDWLALDPDLIGIRAKTVRDRKIIDFEQEYEKEIGPTGIGIEDLFQEGVDEKVETARTNVSQVEEKASRTRAWIKWGNVLGMPALVIMAGLTRFTVRRRRKNNFLKSQEVQS